jgi:ribonuclease HII
MSIYGIDEVGRGAVAGDLVLAGCELKSQFPIHCFHKIITNKKQKNTDLFTNTNYFLEDKIKWQNENYKNLQNFRDSKKLAPKKREKVLLEIENYQIFSCVVSASNKLIDDFGIAVCIRHLIYILILINLYSKFSEINLALLGENQIKALFKNQISDLQIFLDGKINILKEINLELLEKLFLENQNPTLNQFDTFFSLIQKSQFPDNFTILKANLDWILKNLNIKAENFADDNYLSIAIASNLAKVFRDQKMTNLSQKYPDFQWEKNKGYGTKKHLEIIANNLDNPQLRKSYLKKYFELDK